MLILVGDVVIAVCFFIIGRSVTRIRFVRIIRRMADGYRRRAEEIRNSRSVVLETHSASELLGRASALCDLVDQL